MLLPVIEKAAKLIAYDNGMVNRANSEAQVLSEVETRLGRFTAEELAQTAEELGKLTDEELFEVCCGEQYPNISDLADRVLSNVFEAQP